MSPFVEARLCRLPCRFDQRCAILDERNAEIVRACMYGYAQFQILVERRVLIGIGRLVNRESPDRLPVDQHQQLVRTLFTQPADASGEISSKPDLNVVLTV